MKHYALFSSEIKEKKNCHLLQFLFGALRVKPPMNVAFYEKGNVLTDTVFLRL